MALIFKHEAVLTFVGRMIHDREFAEWFAARPSQALASHGLSPQDVRDLADVLSSERRQRDLAVAMQPVVTTMLTLVDTDRDIEGSDEARLRGELLQAELIAARERVAATRAQARPWWKFW
jgi:hypothetical protein